MQSFRLIDVRIENELLHAVINRTQLTDPECSDELKQDFNRLSEQSCEAVRLDASAVTSCDGRFPGLLLNLARLLSQTGRRLTVIANPNLEYVLRITKLDQSFDVVESK